MFVNDNKQYMREKTWAKLSKVVYSCHLLQWVLVSNRLSSIIDMVGIRLLECSQRYYILRHQMYCRSMFKVTPIANDFLTQRHYHDLASTQGKFRNDFFLRNYRKANYFHSNCIICIAILLVQITNLFRRLPWFTLLFVFRIPKFRAL